MLETLFDDARRYAPSPAADFLARLTAVMEANIPTPTTRSEPRNPDLLHRFRTLFAASGLTGAAVLGLWIGFVMPDFLNNMATGFDTTEVYGLGTFLPSADLAALE